LPLNAKDEVIISIDITNTGNRAGKEVVQLYSADLYASLIPDVKRLRRFEKISLAAGETKTVTFKLTLNDLAFVNFDNKRVVEAGDFVFQIGASSSDIKEKIKFTVQ
jgi:beta-glucosidase